MEKWNTEQKIMKNNKRRKTVNGSNFFFVFNWTLLFFVLHIITREKMKNFFLTKNIGFASHIGTNKYYQQYHHYQDRVQEKGN